jgi:ABC-type sugar transport system permease subunit
MIVSYLYVHGFQFQDLGYASAVGWVLVVLISIVAYAQLRVTGALKDVA